MLSLELLKDLLGKKEYGRKDKLLLILASEGAVPRTVSQIRQLAVSSGLRAAKDWNLSAILASNDNTSVRTDAGWELTADGKARVATLVGPAAAPVPTAQAAVDLRAHVAKIADPDVLAFLTEAVACLEAKQLRAAVVLSWVGAIAVLYDYVLTHELPAFNAEAVRRDAKWKAAKTADDLSRMKEHDFLNVLESLSIIGKNVKQELQNALTLRNACGHPNSLRVGPNRVAAHIELLTLNVFGRF
jgi:hypothetical protein